MHHSDMKKGKKNRKSTASAAKNQGEASADPVQETAAAEPIEEDASFCESETADAEIVDNSSAGVDIQADDAAEPVPDNGETVDTVEAVALSGIEDGTPQGNTTNEIDDISSHEPEAQDTVPIAGEAQAEANVADDSADASVVAEVTDAEQEVIREVGATEDSTTEEAEPELDTENTGKIDQHEDVESQVAEESAGSEVVGDNAENYATEEEREQQPAGAAVAAIAATAGVAAGATATPRVSVKQMHLVLRQAAMQQLQAIRSLCHRAATDMEIWRSTEGRQQEEELHIYWDVWIKVMDKRVQDTADFLKLFHTLADASREYDNRLSEMASILVDLTHPIISPRQVAPEEGNKGDARSSKKTEQSKNAEAPQALPTIPEAVAECSNKELKCTFQEVSLHLLGTMEQASKVLRKHNGMVYKDVIGVESQQEYDEKVTKMRTTDVSKFPEKEQKKLPEKVLDLVEWYEKSIYALKADGNKLDSMFKESSKHVQEAYEAFAGVTHAHMVGGSNAVYYRSPYASSNVSNAVPSGNDQWLAELRYRRSSRALLALKTKYLSSMAVLFERYRQLEQIRTDVLAPALERFSTSFAQLFDRIGVGSFDQVVERLNFHSDACAAIEAESTRRILEMRNARNRDTMGNRGEDESKGDSVARSSKTSKEVPSSTSVAEAEVDEHLEKADVTAYESYKESTPAISSCSEAADDSVKATEVKKKGAKSPPVKNQFSDLELTQSNMQSMSKYNISSDKPLVKFSVHSIPAVISPLFSPLVVRVGMLYRQSGFLKTWKPSIAVLTRDFNLHLFPPSADLATHPDVLYSILHPSKPQSSGESDDSETHGWGGLSTELSALAESTLSSEENTSVAVNGSIPLPPPAIPQDLVQLTVAYASRVEDLLPEYANTSPKNKSKGGMNAVQLGPQGKEAQPYVLARAAAAIPEHGYNVTVNTKLSMCPQIHQHAFMLTEQPKGGKWASFFSSNPPKVVLRGGSAEDTVDWILAIENLMKYYIVPLTTD